MSVNPRIVKESFTHIEPFADKAAAYFYGRLFADNPRLRTLFPPAMDSQREQAARAEVYAAHLSPGEASAVIDRAEQAARETRVAPGRRRA